MRKIEKEALSSEEGEVFVNHLIMLCEWGFQFSKLDLCLVVKSYLDKSDQIIKKFKDKIPGEEWQDPLNITPRKFVPEYVKI